MYFTLSMRVNNNFTQLVYTKNIWHRKFRDSILNDDIYNFLIIVKLFFIILFFFISEKKKEWNIISRKNEYNITTNVKFLGKK